MFFETSYYGLFPTTKELHVHALLKARADYKRAQGSKSQRPQVRLGTALHIPEVLPYSLSPNCFLACSLLSEAILSLHIVKFRSVTVREQDNDMLQKKVSEL